VATGPGIEIGRIGKALERLDPEPTPLQLETARLVKAVSLAPSPCDEDDDDEAVDDLP
jgi:hypothetical protein